MLHTKCFGIFTDRPRAGGSRRVVAFGGISQKVKHPQWQCVVLHNMGKWTVGVMAPRRNQIETKHPINKNRHQRGDGVWKLKFPRNWMDLPVHMTSTPLGRFLDIHVPAQRWGLPRKVPHGRRLKIRARYFCQARRRLSVSSFLYVTCNSPLRLDL